MKSHTFVTVLYGMSSLGGFVVSHVAQPFTFPRELVLDDHTIFNITILLKEKQMWQLQPNPDSVFQRAYNLNLV